MTPKSAVLAPTARATVRIAARAKAGLRRRERTADRIFVFYASIHIYVPPGPGGLRRGENLSGGGGARGGVFCVRGGVLLIWRNEANNARSKSQFMRFYCR